MLDVGRLVRLSDVYSISQNSNVSVFEKVLAL